MRLRRAARGEAAHYHAPVSILHKLHADAAGTGGRADAKHAPALPRGRRRPRAPDLTRPGSVPPGVRGVCLCWNKVCQKEKILVF